MQALRERAVRHRTGIGGIGQLTRSLLDREGDLSTELARGHLSARQAQLRSTLDNVMARAHDGDNTRGDEEEGPAPVSFTPAWSYLPLSDSAHAQAQHL